MNTIQQFICFTLQHTQKVGLQRLMDRIWSLLDHLIWEMCAADSASSIKNVLHKIYVDSLGTSYFREELLLISLLFPL